MNNLNTMDKLKQARKLAILEQEPNLALFDEIQAVGDKLKGIQGVLKSINVKEAKTYENELETLRIAILDLTESVNSKDTVVNIPLDQLSTQLVKVEQAIKAIGQFKEIKIPDFPTELNLSETQINELLLAIQSIPPFPIKDLEKLMNSLADKLKQKEIEVPEFDYDFLRDKFEKLIKAVKNVSITVSGGGGIDDVSRQNLTNISNNTSSIAGLSIPKHDYIAATYPNTSTEVYTYKLGGSSGTTVGVVTVVYSDAVTKAIISSVTKS